MTLSKETCQRLAEVLLLDTDKYWGRTFGDDFTLMGVEYLKKSIMPHIWLACPTTLQEYIKLFRKLGDVKGWSLEDEPNDCKVSCDECHYGEKPKWKNALNTFVVLATIDWGEAEKYLNSLL